LINPLRPRFFSFCPGLKQASLLSLQEERGHLPAPPPSSPPISAIVSAVLPSLVTPPTSCFLFLTTISSEKATGLFLLPRLEDLCLPFPFEDTSHGRVLFVAFFLPPSLPPSTKEKGLPRWRFFSLFPPMREGRLLPGGG